MNDFVQYTIAKNKTITLSNLAKKWNISRKLLFKLMEEKRLLIVTSKAKRLTSEKYGFTTQHVTRTAIYIYLDKINELFTELKLPKIISNQGMCYMCRKVKGIKAFRERSVSCIECREGSLKKLKKDEKSLKNCKIEINPYFLRGRNG